ncbi:MAG TPA: hypothetical protein VHZ81_12800 [Galbitalea sp.]|nr:hypothetical protein [Galbitalea sp.]
MRSVLSWLPWVGLVVAVGVVGGVLGLTGVFGHPTTDRVVFANDASLARTAAALTCPAGAEVTRLQAGDRVVAVARSEDSSYLGVRNPQNIAQTVWVSRDVVAIDPGQPSIATLPVSSCPTVSILMPPTKHSSTTKPTTPTKPTAPTKPPKPKPLDKTAPKLAVPTAGTDTVCTANSNPPHSDTITVTASDNVGVASVAISWGGAVSGNGHMTHAAGSTWTYLYNVGSSNAAGTITFQLQAKDAVGNLSSPTKVSITQAGCVG